MSAVDVLPAHRLPPPPVAPRTEATPGSVAFVLPNGLDLGGVTTWSLRMAAWLRDRGQTVTLLSHASAVPGGIGKVPEGVAFHPVDARAFVPHEGYVGEFVDEYAAALPGVVIPNYSLGAYAATALLAQTRPADVRVLGFAHADVEEYYEHLAYYEPMIHAFVAVAPTVARELRRRIPHRAKDIHVRACAVPTVADLDRTYAGPGEPLRLAYGGRLETEQKRVYDLVALAEALHARGVPFQLDIAGSGPAEREIRRRVRALPTAARDAVRLHGQLPTEAMAAFWDAADVVVLTSSYEGTSVSMLEAMGRGCIPVVTAVSGTGPVIDPGVNGYTAPVGDVEGLADAVAALDAARDRLPAFGQAALCAARDAAQSGPYIDWMLGLLRDVEAMPPRRWPDALPLHPGQYGLLGVPLPLVPAAIRLSEWLRRYPRVHRTIRKVFRGVAHARR